MEVLTLSRQNRLAEVLTEELRRGDLRVLQLGDNEVGYTRHVLLPLVDKTIDGVNFPGLVRGGSEQGKLRASHFLGQPFYPDIVVEHFSRPIIAIEVKLLKGPHVQNAVATAIGQAVVYGRRYPERIVMLLAQRPGLSSEDILGPSDWLRQHYGISLVVRQPGVGSLRYTMLSHPTLSRSP